MLNQHDFVSIWGGVAKVLDRVSGIIAQFSKCDFWNLWDFLNRNMNPDSERYGSGGGYDHVIVDLAQSSEM